MSVRRLIVEVNVDGLNVREFCQQHGVSTWFFYDLRRRWRRDGDAVLEPQSRAPKRVWNKTASDVEDAAVAIRKRLRDAGLDYGPEEVAAELATVVASCPAPATVYRILKARGFVVAEPRKAPKRSRRRFNAARANESWQLDDTTWALADGTEVKILNVIDDHSRLLVASTAMTTCTGAAALAVVADAAATLGWPARFQSDNASIFRHVLADALRPLGVAAAHSRPQHPQTNGKVERFHQTEHKWLAAHEPVDTIADLQHSWTCSGTTTTITDATAESAATSPLTCGPTHPKPGPPTALCDRPAPSTAPASSTASSASTATPSPSEPSTPATTRSP